MTEDRAKRGVLILVVGPSGAGKDTLLNIARQRLAENTRFVFPNRVITRPDTSGEDHIISTLGEFERLQKADGFFLSWDAHGLRYGIPVCALHDLRAGRNVVINISRRVIDEARTKWPRTEVIFVAVAPEILRHRLIARGRETLREIEERVRRATDEACAPQGPFHVLDNSKSIAEAGNEFTGLLLTLDKSAAPHEMMTA